MKLLCFFGRHKDKTILDEVVSADHSSVIFKKEWKSEGILKVYECSCCKRKKAEYHTANSIRVINPEWALGFLKYL